ncbi:MAG: hypothetical protein COU40_01980 [Candidatus Moranbacteria bacterium CG10_big_fil_rev_8_21_14_0_10_35_21]|nr:MAG: hypothetical protein COU40_01980 [Candidatus Moranbacteria bacterium CG10_big_fil_rev_8_21_14_0_10_35_21]PJA88866.1 MAG: hypothetical protein CO139_00845 [Candidatus Moranbacteria bacterium CG_4_9_14_3_um_filter_36_9]
MENNKRILLVTRPITPPWDEASKNFAFYLSKNLASFNFNLLTNGPIPELPENVTQIPIYSSNHFSLLQKTKLFLHLILNRKKYPLMHYIFTPTKLNTFLAKYFIQNEKTKSIQTIATLREDIYSENEIKKMMFGNLIVTYSEHSKLRLNRMGFQNVEKIFPGIDLEYYSPAPKKTYLLNRWGVKPDEFVITYPGEYVRLKGIDVILEMMMKFSKILQEKKIKIIFACRIKHKADKKKKQEVINKLDQAGILEMAVFTDTIFEMNDLYNSSDVIIFPVNDMRGKFDIPLSAIEPMACQKPVVVSDLSIFSEFANPDNSVIIKRDDPKQLMDAILGLYHSKEGREKLGEKARKFTEDNFDINKIAQKYQEIYEQI